MITAIIVDSSGVEVIANYDHDGHAQGDLLTTLSGWTGGVGVRSENVDRLTHGAFRTESFRTGRALTVGMLFERSDRGELWRLERGISGLFSEGGFGSLTVQADDLELSCEVRLDGEVKPLVNLDAGQLVAEVPLFAPLPWLYGVWRESVLRPVGAGVGLVFPLFAPDGVLSFGSAISDDVVVWNDGNAVSFPQFVVTADAPGGFTVSLGGARVSYPYPCFASSPVVVDMAGSVVAGGGDVSDRVTAVWGGVGPKEMLQPGFELLSGGSGFCVVRHRDTYV